MSKVFLLNDARILDKFNSDYLFWIDAGISNTLHTGYFYYDKEKQGLMSAATLKAIAERLDEINEEWNTIVKNMINDKL
jgi:hypothetical protein